MQDLTTKATEVFEPISTSVASYVTGEPAIFAIGVAVGVLALAALLTIKRRYLG